jgi:hypothetical protein
MRSERHRSVIRAALAVAAVGFFHIARPIAVSAQSQASGRVQATVVAADAAWRGHVVSEALVGRVIRDAMASAARDSDPRRSVAPTYRIHAETGTVVWVEPTRADASTRTVTVAHLAN